MVNRRPAGRRYPHATTDRREADHSYCQVVDAVRERVAAGLEPWGTRHDMPAELTPTLEQARRAKNGLYLAGRHTRLKRHSCGGGEQLSVQAAIDQTPAGPVVWFRVFTYDQARAEIARRVQAGEQLAYNVMRRQ